MVQYLFCLLLTTRVRPKPTNSLQYADNVFKLDFLLGLISGFKGPHTRRFICSKLFVHPHLKDWKLFISRYVDDIMYLYTFKIIVHWAFNLLICVNTYFLYFIRIVYLFGVDQKQNDGRRAMVKWHVMLPVKTLTDVRKKSELDSKPVF